ncbi:MAG: hypothetical protein RL596_2299, partial [Bacteroidota bacterium]
MVIALFIVTIIGLLFSRALLSLSCGFWFIAGILSLFNKATPFNPHPLFIWSVTPLSLSLLGLWQYPFEKANYDLVLSWAAYPAIAMGAVFIRASGAATVCKKIWIYGAAIAALYPLLWLLFHFSDAIALIKIGKAIPVFMDNDHLRFSIYIASALLLSYTLENKKLKQLLIFFFIAVLLLLSVRTGVVMALLIIIANFVYWLLDTRYRLRVTGYGLRVIQNSNLETRISKPLNYGLQSTVYGLALLLLSLPFLSQKLNYTLYDYQQFSTKGYNPAYSDGVRRAVNNASIEAAKNNYIV